MNQKLIDTRGFIRMGGAALILITVILAAAAQNYLLLLLVSYVLAMGVMRRKMRGALGASARGGNIRDGTPVSLERLSGR